MSLTKFHVKCTLHDQESLQQSHKDLWFFLFRTTMFFTTWDGSITPLGSIETPQLVGRTHAPVPAADSLLNHNQEFERILSAMGIPQTNQSEILRKVASMATQGFSGGTMMVIIFAVTYQEFVPNELDHDLARAERESMEAGFRTIPATKSSIDALERVIFDGVGSSPDCTVCMEEIKDGAEAIRMPCFHVYHSSCIVQWLEISHLCPLCRYRMPYDM